MNIAIAGFGVEGRENYAYWAKNPMNDLTIVDERGDASTFPAGAASLTGEGVFGKLQDFDMVVRSPSIAPSSIATNGVIWSATNEFFATCPAPIIGVTGTKGKGTTASMIASLFEAAGKKVWLVGNIGTPALSVLSQIEPDDVVVYELSSFQLWDMQSSPHTAVVLLVEPEHLDVHADMNDYVDAKAHIARFQTEADFCVYHPSNLLSKKIADESAASVKERYGASDGNGVYVEGDVFRTAESTLCPVAALQLKGQHNIENACAALSVAVLHGISGGVIERGLRTFQGLPHRLEYVRTVNGVAYYNDSFSSAPAATVAALHAFETPEILIIGGVDRGASFKELGREIAKNSTVKEVVLIGAIRTKLAEIFSEVGVTAKVTVLDAKTMPEIVAYAGGVAEEGDTVILSPGCASFDMFKDFYDRGTQFREEVCAL